MDQIKARIRAFVERAIGGRHAIQDDEDIFAMGYVNEAFAMQLVSFVEQEFQITILSEDLDLNNFRSVSALASLVSSKAG